MTRITNDLLTQLGISLGRFREEQVRGIEKIVVVDRFTFEGSEGDWIRFGTSSGYRGYPTHLTETWITLPDTDMTAREYLLRERVMSMFEDTVRKSVSIGEANVNDHVAYIIPIETMPITFRAKHQPDIPSRLVGYQANALVDTSEGAVILEAAIATEYIEDASRIVAIIGRYLGEGLKTERNFSAQRVYEVLHGYGLSIDKISVSKLAYEQPSSPVKVNDFSKLRVYGDVRELAHKDNLDVWVDAAAVRESFVRDFDRAIRALIGTPTVIQLTTDNLILGKREYTLDGSGRTPLKKGGMLYCKLAD